MSEHDHQDILTRVTSLFSEILDDSKQGVYIYLDDINKACNKRFAALLGYSSPKEWASVGDNFPEAFVTPKDRQILVSAYQKAMNELAGSTVSITWKKKDGREARTTTILVPIVYEGHRLALHFISPA